MVADASPKLISAPPVAEREESVGGACSVCGMLLAAGEGAAVVMLVVFMAEGMGVAILDGVAVVVFLVGAVVVVLTAS